MTQTPASAPALLRHRILHTRLFAALMLALLPFQVSYWPHGRPFHELIEGLSLLLLIGCVVGRVWCALYIGGRKKRELVVGGPYSVVRNPLYLFSFLGVLGIGLADASLTLTLLLALVFALYYRVAVRREESYLAAAFGADYARYLARVPRWWPNPGLWRPASAFRPDPRFVLRTLRDSAVFLLAVPFFELIDYAQDLGWLPVLWHLP